MNSIRYKAATVKWWNYSVARCDHARMCRVRLLLLCLCVLVAITLTLAVSLSNYQTVDLDFPPKPPDLFKDKLNHQPGKPTVAQVKRLVSQVNRERLWYSHLRPILTERQPGSRGSQAVRKHIFSQLDSLTAGWSVEVDSFISETPHGPVSFTNVLAVLDPMAPRRLLLACHYDSKFIPSDPSDPRKVFVGASDSAVPCAMMLELVTALDPHLRKHKQLVSRVTLQLVFFDGGEAFEQWSQTDSLYGSRHLADSMSRIPHPPGSEQTTLLNAVDLLVLLDLIGAPDPMFVNHFENTARWFDRLIAAEKRLHNLGLLSSHPKEQTYFMKDVNMGPVEDDHIPFLQRGVPVLHIIATPFPSFLHTMDDTVDKVHSHTVENLTKVLVVFLAEYLRL
ncbi:glutaminyl-peptide cyclotransferase isoform X2 [Carassius auratus]|uniref:Glutaminyl-peptide cyclotransferase n=1 Tax=Carassius auratus TaxID=7957 RepID=A0A6P6M3H3_CARAU|nr:glutaminyl-peptide cyclotransferase-like isoform X2 [Carassius auratus]XP_052392561.1 glutaminyl-peptide cyclotransferase isoform X2 [Carassius gibelio]